MAYILRKIRRAKWYKHENVPWLEEGDLQADTLSDLETKGNTLSVWYISEDRSNLDRVVTALAASGDVISVLDFALLDEQALTRIDIKVAATHGDTPDEDMNALWHRDLIELSAAKLMQLAQAIFGDAEKTRVMDKRIEKLLRDGINTGQINPQKLRDKLRAKLVER